MAVLPAVLRVVPREAPEAATVPGVQDLTPRVGTVPVLILLLRVSHQTVPIYIATVPVARQIAGCRQKTKRRQLPFHSCGAASENRNPVRISPSRICAALFAGMAPARSAPLDMGAPERHVDKGSWEYALIIPVRVRIFPLVVHVFRACIFSTTARDYASNWNSRLRRCRRHEKSNAMPALACHNKSVPVPWEPGRTRRVSITNCKIVTAPAGNSHFAVHRHSTPPGHSCLEGNEENFPSIVGCNAAR
jgi:hypothetical protein